MTAPSRRRQRIIREDRPSVDGHLDLLANDPHRVRPDADPRAIEPAAVVEGEPPAVPGAGHGAVHDEPVAERCPLVRAGVVDRVITPAVEEQRLPSSRRSRRGFPRPPGPRPPGPRCGSFCGSSANVAAPAEGGAKPPVVSRGDSHHSHSPPPRERRPDRNPPAMPDTTPTPADLARVREHAEGLHVDPTDDDSVDATLAAIEMAGEEVAAGLEARGRTSRWHPRSASSTPRGPSTSSSPTATARSASSCSSPRSCKTPRPACSRSTAERPPRPSSRWRPSATGACP